MIKTNKPKNEGLSQVVSVIMQKIKKFPISKQGIKKCQDTDQLTSKAINPTQI